MIGYALPTASYLIHKDHITGIPDRLGKSLSNVFSCDPNQLQDEVQKMFNFSQSKNRKKKKKIQISQTFFVWRWFLEPYGRRWEVAVMVER